MIFLYLYHNNIKIEIMDRLETLRNRYDRIVNRDYVHSKKSEIYFKTLYDIKNEIYKVEAKNRKINQNNPYLLALRSTKGLNGSQILMLR